MNRLIIVFLSCFNLLYSQELLTKKFDLPKEVDETSGLIYFNQKLITHNDSGGLPVLYEINMNTGELERKITISNATNQDWEDVAQDNDFIYVGDMGNNKGNRENLKIYKINKQDYVNNNSVKAEIIQFFYEDQESFKSDSKNNFDAEALLSLDDELIIFSKNRGDNKSKAYVIPKVEGKHKAKIVNTFNVNGLITGATKNTNTGEIVLCGYSSGLSPFLIFIDYLTATSFIKLELVSYIGLGNQTEGITYVNDNNYYISRERVNKSVAGFSVKIPQSVFVFDKNQFQYNFSTVTNYFESIKNGKFNSGYNFKSVKIWNKKDKLLIKEKDSFEFINTDALKSGKYWVRIKLNDEISVTEKIVLNEE